MGGVEVSVERWVVVWVVLGMYVRGMVELGDDVEWVGRVAM